MIDLKVVSEKEFRNMKKNKKLVIYFGFHDCPFGRCLIGLLEGRICHVSFVASLDSANLKVLKSQWPDAALMRNEKFTIEIAKKMFSCETELYKVLMKGTHFEAKVWQALLNIAKGETVSYEEVAMMIGHGRAVRPAANAVAKNPVAYLVPCHRVIKKDGRVHKYQWGSHIKRKILDFEKFLV